MNRRSRSRRASTCGTLRACSGRGSTIPVSSFASPRAPAYHLLTMPATAVQLSAFALLLSWIHPGAVGAQVRFPRVQYVAGRPELMRPTEVTLVLDDRELRAEQTVYSDRGSSVRTA